jgi:hypothetical protein
MVAFRDFCLAYIKCIWRLHRSETIKYFIRFGLVIMVVVPILKYFRGPDSIPIIFYKIANVFIGVAVAELIWAVFFKPYFGIAEATSDDWKNSCMVFRGLLYAGCIIGFCLGL